MSDQEKEDPLDGAAVGEKRTVRVSKTLHGINYEPRAFFGSDRQGSARIVDVEVIEDDRDGYCDDFRVTWEGDMTKRLPRNWDRANEPRTAQEERAARRKRWGSHAARALGILIPVGLAMFIAMHVMNATAGSLTINGEQVSQPTFVETAFIFLLVVGFAGLLMWAVRNAPGHLAGNHRRAGP